MKAVSQALAPQPVTVDVLFDDDYGQGACERGGGEEMAGRGKGKWISTGDEGLDECLGGGLRRGCLYEIAGERYGHFNKWMGGFILLTFRWTVSH